MGVGTHKPGGKLATPHLGLVKLYNKVVFGAAGAVASQTAAGVAGFTVAKAGTGELTLTFEDPWEDLVFVQAVVYNGGTAKGQFVEVHDKLGATTAKVAYINVVSDAGAAEDVASGHELWIECTMSNAAYGPQV